MKDLKKLTKQIPYDSLAKVATKPQLFKVSPTYYIKAAFDKINSDEVRIVVKKIFSDRLEKQRKKNFSEKYTEL